MIAVPVADRVIYEDVVDFHHEACLWIGLKIRYPKRSVDDNAILQSIDGFPDNGLDCRM